MKKFAKRDADINYFNTEINEKLDFTTIKEKYHFGPAIVGATVRTGAIFANCTFNDSLIGFRQAKDYVIVGNFTEPLLFYNCTFNAPLIFRQNIFQAGVYFTNCTFNADVHFEGANFGGNKNDFKESIFNKGAFFTSSKFSGEVNFMNVTFDSLAKFNNCKFEDKANFSVVKFNQKSDFSNIQTVFQIKFNYSHFRDKFILSNINAKDDVFLQSIVSDTIFDCRNNKSSGSLLLQKSKFKGKLTIYGNNFKNLDMTDVDFTDAQVVIDSNFILETVPVRSFQ